MLLRVFLWGIAVAIASFPTFQADHFFPTLDPIVTMALINSHGHLRDLFFVIVPAAAVSLSTTMEFLSSCVIRKSTRRGHTRPTATVGFLALLAVLGNTVILLSGFIGFLLIPPGSGPVDVDALKLYSNLILWGLGISLATEMGISTAVEFNRG
jgi:hypothetical protein